MQKRSLTVLYRVMLVIALCVIMYLATTSRRIPVVEDINDKANHIAAFFVLALLVDFSWPGSGFGRAKALGLFGYGLLIEIVQYYIPSRTFSLYDVAADTVGLALFALSVPLLRNIPPFNRRFGA